MPKKLPATLAECKTPAQARTFVNRIARENPIQTGNLLVQLMELLYVEENEAGKSVLNFEKEWDSCAVIAADVSDHLQCLKAHPVS